MRSVLLLGCALALGALGCGGDSGHDTDSGHVGPGMDTGPVPVDAFHGGPQDVGPGVDGGCIPGVEICGDHIDENCDGRESPCGDHDGDTFDACSPADTDLTRCDCNDDDRNTYPITTLAGGPEACDSRDNDCDGRVDESAACCAECQALGDATRGNLCGTDGSCQCTTNAGMAPCGAGQACCTGGCVDTSSDTANCGSCGFACTTQSDRCVAGECYCGAPPGVACTADTTCTAGACN